MLKITSWSVWDIWLRTSCWSSSPLSRFLCCFFIFLFPSSVFWRFLVFLVSFTGLSSIGGDPQLSFLEASNTFLRGNLDPHEHVRMLPSEQALATEYVRAADVKACKKAVSLQPARNRNYQLVHLNTFKAISVQSIIEKFNFIVHYKFN